MAKGRLVVENGFGRVFAFSVGGGEALLVMESDGEALTVGLAASEAIRLAAYLSEVAEDVEASQRPQVVHQPAEPPAPAALPASNGHEPEPSLHQVAAVFNSAAAGRHKPGGRTAYVAQRFGWRHSKAVSRVQQARKAGLTTPVRNW